MDKTSSIHAKSQLNTSSIHAKSQLNTSSIHAKSQLNTLTGEQCEILLNIAIQYKNQYGVPTVDWNPLQTAIHHFQMPFVDNLDHCQQGSKKDSSNNRQPVKDDVYRKFYQHLIENAAKYGYDKVNPLYLDLYSQFWGEQFSSNQQMYGGAVNPCINVETKVESDQSKLEASAIYGLDEKCNLTDSHALNSKDVDKKTEKYRKKFFDSQYQKFKNANMKEKISRKIYSRLPATKKRDGNSSKRQNSLKRQTPLKRQKSLKRQLLDELDESDKQHQYNMQAMIDQIQRQSQLINEGFILMRSMLLPEFPDFSTGLQNPLYYSSYVQRYTGYNNPVYPEQPMPSNHTHFFQ